MIKGVHAMFYSSRADELRAFLRDKLGLRATDVGQGWLIFDVPDAEIGCHPADPAHGAPSGMNHISFYCDDVNQTVAELKKRGVEFTAGIEDHGYGLVTQFMAPGDFTVQLYQPRYQRNPPPKRNQATKRKVVKAKQKTKARVKRK
jgi:catechol 2,3-dioxygenase-like lactoylglutathione lyase family enzyme